MGSRNFIKDGVVSKLRNTILILIALSIFIFSGCSNGADSVSSSSDSEYNEMMAKAKELHKQGKTEEAFEVISDVVIKSEDMNFLTELLDVINKDAVPMLDLIDIEVSRDEDYIRATGSVKNNGNTSYFYIKVKAIYMDANDNVIDTDWTYAIDSLGIEPNETKKFEMMTKYPEGIKKYKFELFE